MPGSPLTTFSLFAPPYQNYLAIDPSENLAGEARLFRGVALIWNAVEGNGTRELDVAAHRPGSLPLVVILPPARDVKRFQHRILELVEHARPHSILPHHPRPAPDEMLQLIRRPPEDLPEELLDFLIWRGIILDQETRRIIRRTVELSAELTTLTALARGLYLSRRALGRRFQQRGLPVPSHWLQFSRILRAAIALQNSNSPLDQIARSLNYPDGFTLSNQMVRIIGVRPSSVRSCLGWEWIVEAWLETELQAGKFDTQPLRLNVHNTPCHDGIDGHRIAVEVADRPHLSH